MNAGLFKKFNTTHLCFSIIFAIVFTLFSAHWFIKSEYWQNDYGVPEISHLSFQITKKHDYDQEIVKREETKEFTFAETNNIDYSGKTRITKDYVQQTLFFVVTDKYANYKFSFIPQIDSEIRFIIPRKRIGNSQIWYPTFKINGKEYIQRLKGSKITARIQKGQEVTIEMQARYVAENKSKTDYINYFSLFATLIFYSAINYVAICRLTPFFSKRNVLVNLIAKIKENKFFLLIMFFFFAFYIAINSYAGTHINYFAKYWVVLGDANWNLMDIMYSTTKRFHPWAFLPLYPFFDFLLVVTKNFFASIFLIHTIATTLTIGFLYKSLELINPKNITLNILITSIFGFSWSTIITNYNFDLYIFTGLYLSLIAYLITKELKAEEKSNLRIILIGIFSAFTLGVTSTNIITIFILLIPFLFSKQKVKRLLIILFAFLTVATGCALLKNSTCNGGATKNLFYKDTKNITTQWFNPKDKSNFENFKNKAIRNSIAENNKPLANAIFYAWLSICLLGLILSFVQKNKLNKEDRRIFYTLTCALVYNFASVYFWASHAGLLFSPNHFVLWFILFGYSIKFIDASLTRHNYLLKNNVCYLIILLFVTLLACSNYHENKQLQTKILQKHPLTYNILEKKL